MMPGMDGVEFIQYVRSTERYAQTKIIVMTALHEDDLRITAVKGAGIERVLYKPWDDEDLIRAIKDIYEDLNS